MKYNLIGIVDDKDFGLELCELNNPVTRQATRAIVIRDDNKIALLNKVKKGECKLPGGGIEENEDIVEALKREIIEETGCEVEVLNKLGIIIEEKNKNNFRQTSHVFLVKVTKYGEELELTKKELDEGSICEWLDLNDAYKKIKKSLEKEMGSEYDNKYSSLFMVKRDIKILEYYMNNLK